MQNRVLQQVNTSFNHLAKDFARRFFVQCAMLSRILEQINTISRLLHHEQMRTFTLKYFENLCFVIIIVIMLGVVTLTTLEHFVALMCMSNSLGIARVSN